MNDSRLLYLFNQFFHKQATPDEKQAFLELLSMQENDEKVKELFDKAWKQFAGSTDIFTAEQSKEMLGSIFLTEHDGRVVPTISVSRRSFSWRMAAAVVVLLITGTVMYLQNSKKDFGANTGKQRDSALSEEIISPGGDKAFLTLADGSTIVLDTAEDGAISLQGNSKVRKQNDQLIYDQSKSLKEVDLIYNSISTPRGGEYSIILSDGSKVRLNAASSLRFPTSFSGNERVVYLKGEAYFDVAKNFSKPFKIELNEGMEVEVVGTSFNVMAYDEEADIRTTLVEGMVKVTKSGHTVDLLPMQQAVMHKNSSDLTVAPADLEEAVAWKDGRFYFNEDNILSIMRKLSRWYNVDVNYSGPVPSGHYSGSIRRQAKITQVFEMLELPGGIEFTLEGRKIMVRSK